MLCKNNSSGLISPILSMYMHFGVKKTEVLNILKPETTEDDKLRLSEMSGLGNWHDVGMLDLGIKIFLRN